MKKSAYLTRNTVNLLLFSSDWLTYMSHLLVFLFSFNAIPLLAKLPQFTIFSTSHYPVAVSPDSSVYFLDAPQQLEAKLSHPLSWQPGKAEQQIKPLINAELHQTLETAYQGVILAWSLNIEKLPAVVIDKRYVIYGTTDSVLATQYWQYYLRSKQ